MKAVHRSRNAGSLAILVATLCFLILTTSAAGQNSTDWKGGDALFWTAEALLAIDMFQTQYILKNDNYEELNPVIDALGPNYAPLYFLGWMVALPVLGEWLFPEYREWIYGGVATVQLAVVSNNFAIGVGFDF